MGLADIVPAALTSWWRADHVLPDVPLRQWVLSVPFDIGTLMARNARLLSSILRIFVDVVSRWYVTNATPGRASGAKAGAVSLFREQSARNPVG